MHIGFVATFPDPCDPNTSKGGYKFVANLMRLLSDNNKITLFTISERKWSIDLPFCDEIAYLRSPNQLVRWLKITEAIVKRRKILDLLIVYNPSIATLPIVPLKILFSLPTVVEYMDRQTAPAYKRSILRLLGWLSERIFLLTTHNWIVNSTELGNLIRKSRKNSNILLHRTTLSEQPSSDNNTKPLPVKIEARRINICYSGAIHHDYGVDILVDTFTELQTDNFHLFITGSGPMRAELEDKIKRNNLPNITIAFLENEAVEGFLSRMDILVIPYRDTRTMRMASFPSKIIDYMSMGKAIIAADIGELPQVLEHGKTAILIQPGNRQALKDALLELINNEEKRKELAFNARKYFDDNFSEEVVKPKLYKYLAGIV